MKTTFNFATHHYFRLTFMTKQVVESGISRAEVDLTSSIRKQKRVVLGTELWMGKKGGIGGGRGGGREREWQLLHTHTH